MSIGNVKIQTQSTGGRAVVVRRDACARRTRGAYMGWGVVHLSDCCCDIGHEGDGGTMRSERSGFCCCCCFTTKDAQLEIVGVEDETAASAARVVAAAAVGERG